VLPVNNISVLGAEDIYIDCSPTGVSQEEINSYNIPINSKMAKEEETMSTMQTMTNFAAFTMFSFFIAYAAPAFYKATVIKSILTGTMMQGPKPLCENNLKCMYAIDNTIIFIAIILFGISLGVGLGTDNTILTYTGFMIAYAMLAAISILYIQKGDISYMSIGQGPDKKTIEYDNDVISRFNFTEIWKVIQAFVGELFGPKFLSAFALVTFINIIVYIISKDSSYAGTIFGIVEFIAAIFIFIFNVSNNNTK
jgi:hypothetical protein